MAYMHSYIPSPDGDFGKAKDYRCDAEGDTGDLLEKVDSLLDQGRYVVLSDSRGDAFAGYGPDGSHWSRH